MRKTALFIVATLIPLMGCEQSQQPDSPSITIAPFAIHSAHGQRSEEIARELQSLLSAALASNADFVAHNGREVDFEPATLTASSPTHLVTGSVTTVGSRCQISIALIDTLTSYQLWAEVYETAIDDWRSIADRAALEIAAAIDRSTQPLMLPDPRLERRIGESAGRA